MITRKRRREGSFVKKSEEIKKEENEKEVVSEAESFVGISSTDYFNQFSSLIDAYSGKSDHALDTREKSYLEEFFNEAFRPYDQNGNQNLKNDIQFKNQLIRDLKEKVNVPFSLPEDSHTDL